MDSFERRKQDTLNKLDKSSKGDWDEKIVPLCEKINSLEDYYTTSSCSGRIVVMKDESKKGPNLFEGVWHSEGELERFKKSLPKESAKLDLKFKQEPVILHVVCKDLKSSNHLLKLAHKAGFKKIGIITQDKRIVVEINGSEKIEFPLMKKGKILVGDEFLKIVLEKSNDNLKKSWEKIEKLKKYL